MHVCIKTINESYFFSLELYFLLSISQNTQDGDNDKWEKSNTLPHKLSSSNSQTLPSSSSSNAASSLADSPQSRKRFGSASEETILKVTFISFIKQ